MNREALLAAETAFHHKGATRATMPEALEAAIEAYHAALLDEDGLVKEARSAAARIEEQGVSMTTLAIAMKNIGRQTKAGLCRNFAWRPRLV